MKYQLIDGWNSSKLEDRVGFFKRAKKRLDELEPDITALYPRRSLWPKDHYSFFGGLVHDTYKHRDTAQYMMNNDETDKPYFSRVCYTIFMNLNSVILWMNYFYE